MRSRLILLSVLLSGLLLVTAGCTSPVSSDENDTPESAALESEYAEDKKEEAQLTPEDSGKVQVNPKVSSVSSDTATIPVTLYYQDKDGCIVPVTRQVAKQEGIARAAVNGLIDSPINREELEYYGLYPVLPMGTEILGISIKEGVATIDFNDKFLGYESGIAERNVVSSVVYTLTEFKTVNAVRIVINGDVREKLKYDTDISDILSRDNVMINCETLNLGEGQKKADVYVFKTIKESFVYIVPYSKEYSAAADESLPGRIIDFLGEKPDAENTYSEIPSEAYLLDSNVKNGVLTLYFDGALTGYGGQSREDGILKQILYSMKQIDGVGKLRILVDGKTPDLPEGTDVSKEIVIPGEINAVMDKQGGV
mgnify:CR=1 FL=1